MISFFTPVPDESIFQNFIPEFRLRIMSHEYDWKVGNKVHTEKNYIHKWSIGLFRTFQNLIFTIFLNNLSKDSAGLVFIMPFS